MKSLPSILSLLILSASQSMALNWGDFNATVSNTTSQNWSDSSVWVDGEGVAKSTLPTINDSVYITFTPDEKGNGVMDIKNQDAYAKSVKFGLINSYSYGATLRIYGNMLYVGNTGELGGDIISVDSVTGSNKESGWSTGQSELQFNSNSRTEGVSSRFTNASNINVYVINIGTDGGYAGTEWLINTAGVNYKATGWVNIGSNNGYNRGDLAASIHHTAGTFATGKLLLGSSLSNNITADSKYTLDGGTFKGAAIYLGNTTDSSQSNVTVNYNADVNFLSGTMEHYATWNSIVFRDTYGHENDKSTNILNTGTYSVNFGDKMATVDGFAGQHSAAIFYTSSDSSAQIRFEDSVYINGYNGEKGGFTIRGSGVLTNFANNTISGKISVLDSATLLIQGVTSINMGGAVNVNMTGKMFDKVSEIYVSENAKYNFSGATEQKIFAGQTVSGAGQILASTSESLKVYGSLAPMSKNGNAGTLRISGNGTVEMSKNAQLQFNLFSSDGKTISSNDMLSFSLATTFIEMNVGEGLGTMIFDVSQIFEDTSISVTKFFTNATADWTKFDYITNDMDRVLVSYNDGMLNFNIQVPEPSTVAFFIGSLALIYAAARRKK